MDAHKLDVKIQGHSYMHMITVKGHLGNVSLHLNQMINPYEWFVELIFFLEPGWSTDWIICTESRALANCVKQQCFCLFDCWPLGLESANQKCDWFGSPAIHLSGISNLLSVFKGFFYGGGGGRFKSKYWNHGSFDVSLCIQCSKDWQSGDIPYIV